MFLFIITKIFLFSKHSTLTYTHSVSNPWYLWKILLRHIWFLFTNNIKTDRFLILLTLSRIFTKYHLLFSVDFWISGLLSLVNTLLSISSNKDHPGRSVLITLYRVSFCFIRPSPVGYLSNGTLYFLRHRIELFSP